MTNNKVIYIAGLYHSGTTLVDTVLGNIKGVVGLGEIYKAIIDGHEVKCSCGSSSDECVFWRDVELNSNDLFASYNNVFKQFKALYPGGVLVDSSKCHPLPFINNGHKRFKGLNFWQSQPNIELIVIHLYRDPRSWVAGLNRRDQRFSKMGKYSLPKKLKCMSLLRYFQWWYFHKTMASYLESQDIIHFELSYEDFVFQTDAALSQVLNKLDMAEDNLELSLKESKSHISVGNPWRVDDRKNSVISYDWRWLYLKPTLIDWVFGKLLGHIVSSKVYGRLRRGHG